MTQPQATPAGAIRWRRNPAVVLLSLSTIVGTLALASSMRPVGLAEVLLIVLVEVIGVSLVAGRTVAAATAIGATLAVNWLLVPPYGTFRIQAQENWVTLTVFLVLAVGASTLVESVLASERTAAAGIAREDVLAEVLRPESTSAEEALRILSTALDLDDASLVESSTGRVLQSTLDGRGDPPERPTLVVDVAPDYQVRGWGPERLGVRSGYVPTLATAVVRAWESQQLTAEQERSARLAEVDRARAMLLASVGHDLRTPLAGIRVSAEALAMSDSSLSDADRVELLDGLRQSAIRLDEVIGAVLDASRIEAGVLHVDRFATDLGEVAERALHQLASPRVHLHRPEGPVVGSTDPALLERIVANLVSNALAHTPEDTPVEVILAQDERTASIAVVDHGPGLAAESSDVGRSRHGMGLLIVDRLAGLIGADLAFADTPGGGVHVSVRVPR